MYHIGDLLLRTPGGRIPQGMPRGYLAGLVMSNNGSDATNDIDFAVGECRDSTNTEDLYLRTALTKQLDAAWAPGTNAGGLDTGAIANGTYHCYLIGRDSRRPATDVIFSTSATAPTLPSGFKYYRRIGSILRESAAIVAFKQRGDTFERVTRAADVNASNPGASAVTRTLSVPLGIEVTAWVMALIFNGTTANESAYLSALDVTDSGPDRTSVFSLAVGVTTSSWAAGDFYVKTNTSGQIRSRMETGGASDIIRISTKGWVDLRGRFD